MLPAAVASRAAGGNEWSGSGLADSASVLAAGPSSTPTAVDGGTTAGVASRYGALTLVVFVVGALGVLYLWWRRRRRP